MKLADNQKDEFWVEPLAGLGNRMLAMASARFFAEKYHKRLCILWNNDSWLGADFTDLFQMIPECRIVTVKSKTRVQRLLLRFNHWNIRKRLASRCDFVTDINLWGGKSDGEICEMMENGVKEAKRIYVRTWKCFAPIFQDGETGLDFFKPSDRVCMKGQALFERITPYTIGVHIRRTDHEEAIKNSPLNAFIARMRQELEIGEQCDFFVATDSEETKKEIKSIFGERVFFYEGKDLRRNHVNGMIDACVDLWALSKCKKILGSMGSTFGAMAAKLGNDRLEIVTQELVN